MSTKEFYRLSEDSRSFTEVRAWEPGDGLFCSSRTVRSKIPCTVPVAVIRRTLKGGGARWNPEVRHSNACEHHVANVLAEAGYKNPGITTVADKEAREAVVAAHWGEYQAELTKRIEAKKEEQLGKLPTSLREAISAVAEQDGARAESTPQAPTVTLRTFAGPWA